MNSRILTMTLVTGVFIVALMTLDAVATWPLPGSQQGYEPVQPIAYSHRLHAGELQLDCLYCHSGAETTRPWVEAKTGLLDQSSQPARLRLLRSPRPCGCGCQLPDLSRSGGDDGARPAGGGFEYGLVRQLSPRRKPKRHSGPGS